VSIKTSARTGVAESALLLVIVVALSALPHLATLRRKIPLFPRRMPSFDVPTSFESKRSALPPHVQIKPEKPANAEGLRETLEEVAADPELTSRTVHTLMVENPTRITMTFTICGKKGLCRDIDLGPFERVQHRWSGGEQTLHLLYDADPTDGSSTARLRLIPAIATADTPAPPVPHYTFYETNGQLELLLRRVE
jgi:hypothetical protein